jgi:hypothetical protein
MIKKKTVRLVFLASATLVLGARPWAPWPVRAQEAEPESPPTDAPPEAAPEEPIVPAAPAETRSPEPSEEALAATEVKAPTPTEPTASTPAEEPDQASKPRAEVSAAPGKGLTVTVGPKFSLNVRARIQVRYELFIPPKDAQGQRDMKQVVNIGTARIWLGGNILTPKLLYMIQLAVAGPDFREGIITPLYDGYLDWQVHRDFNVKVGQYFVPFDRLRTIREWALEMAARPIPVFFFTLDRDVGVTLYSERFLGSPLAYRIGVFGGGGRSVLTRQEPGCLVVGRLELRPLGDIDDDKEGDLDRRKKPGLALGGAFAANFNTNRQRSTTGLLFVGGSTDYFQAAVDLVFKWRGFAAEAEYLWKTASTDEIISETPEGEPLIEYTESGQGWVAQASYVFDPPIQVVGRWSRTYAFPGTDPAFTSLVESFGQELGAGLNYYFNYHWLKLQATWIGRMPNDVQFDAIQHSVIVQLDGTF